MQPCSSSNHHYLNISSTAMLLLFVALLYGAQAQSNLTFANTFGDNMVRTNQGIYHCIWMYDRT